MNAPALFLRVLDWEYRTLRSTIRLQEIPLCDSIAKPNCETKNS